MNAAGTPLTGTRGAVALLAGAGLALAAPAAPPAWAVVLLLVFGVVLAWRPGALRYGGVVVLGVAIAGGHARHALSIRLPAEPVRTEALVAGRVASLPRREPRRVVFDLDVDASAHSPLAGKQVRVSWYSRPDAEPPPVRAGERWVLPLRAKAPRGLRNPGAGDPEKHALADRLAATAYVGGAGARRLATGAGIVAWRERVSERIAEAVPDPSSRFVRALALGDTRFLSDADWRVLRADGLTHLIAISGFHVGMVAGAAALAVRLLWWLVPGLGRRVPRRIAAAALGVVAAGMYAAAAGFSLPTVRTLVMIAIVAVACAWRRSIGVAGALAWAAIAIVALDPLALLAAGFWLSFAGVAWLAWCLPRDTGPAWASLLRAQAVASVGLLPLTVILFGQASAAGPLANLVAVPLWSLLVAPLAVGGVALDVVWPAGAAWLWRAASFALDPAWPLFEAMARSPLALHWLPEPHALALPLALLGAGWMLLPRGLPGRWLALALWLPLLWPDARRPPPGEVEVTAIDVGQGLAVLVRTHRHALLYDTGPAVPDGFDAGERAVVPVLHARGVGGGLDRLVLSHADNDHAGGLQAVLDEVPVALLQAPEGAGIQGASTCRGGEAWAWDGVRFEWLHPPPYFPYLANESSCVLRFEAAGRAVLLTGDIGEIIERRLVADVPSKLRADLAFAGHHGSRHSSDPAFIAATGARHVVFSTGHGNRFRHPARSVVERWSDAGARPWDTARHGALTFRVRDRGTEVESHRDRTARLWDATRIPAPEAGLSYRRD